MGWHRRTGTRTPLAQGWLRLAHGKKIVTMDDDLQHSPDALPALLAALGEDQDVCYAGFHNKRHALWKRAGSSFNDIMATLLLG
ncbi:hypothetical protein G6F59_017305 [Rhizopus arrhizus]|nr:hypothetical protein G6F59_017305 [Rhizopus arrhizus]